MQNILAATKQPSAAGDDDAKDRQALLEAARIDDDDGATASGAAGAAAAGAESAGVAAAPAADDDDATAESQPVLMRVVTLADAGHSSSYRARTNDKVMIRFLALVALALSASLAVVAVTMAAENRPGEENVSSTLVTFAVIFCLCALASAYDCYAVWVAYASNRRHLDAAEQHRLFRGFALVAVVQSAALFPTVTTFLFHALGLDYFKAVYDKLDQRHLDLINFHVVSYCLLLLAGVGALFVVRHAHRNHYDYDTGSRPGSQRNSLVGDAIVPPPPTGERAAFAKPSLAYVVGAKTHSVFTIGAALCYGVSLIRANDVDANSGVVTATVLDMALLLIVVFYSLFIVVRLQHRRSWMLSFRSVHVLQQLFAYVSFWLVLLAVSLDGQFGMGFVSVVEKLDSARAAYIRSMLGLFAAMVVVACLRTFLHKLKLRLPPGADVRALAAHAASASNLRKFAFGFVDALPARSGTANAAASASNVNVQVVPLQQRQSGDGGNRNANAPVAAE